MIEFPESLWESHLHQRKMCLVCAQSMASMVLRGDNGEIVPLCKGCSSEWNFHSYEILKRIKPWRLLYRTLWFKMTHPIQCPSLWTVWKDLMLLQAWAKKMKRWLKSRKGHD